MRQDIKWPTTAKARGLSKKGLQPRLLVIQQGIQGQNKVKPMLHMLLAKEPSIAAVSDESKSAMGQWILSFFMVSGPESAAPVS